MVENCKSLGVYKFSIQRFADKSLAKIRNNRSPKSEPCETQQLAVFTSGFYLLYLTYCYASRTCQEGQKIISKKGNN